MDLIFVKFSIKCLHVKPRAAARFVSLSLSAAMQSQSLLNHGYLTRILFRRRDLTAAQTTLNHSSCWGHCMIFQDRTSSFLILKSKDLLMEASKYMITQDMRRKICNLSTSIIYLVQRMISDSASPGCSDGKESFLISCLA